MLQSRLKLKQWFSGFNLGVFVYVLTVFLALVTFQNCSEPLDFSEQDQATLSDQLPFAYDLKLDTFAYMSCANLMSAEFDNRAMFNFRMGAYEPNSGLKLSDDYLQFTANYTPEARAETLYRSPTNTGAIMQMAIRNTSQNLQEHFQQERGTTSFGADVDNFLLGAPLSAPGIGRALADLDNDKRINYFKGTPGLDGRLIEASLRQYEFDALRIATNGFFNNLGLAITYTVEENSLSHFARGPDLNNVTREVYGYKYLPTFNGPKKKFGYPEVGYTGTYEDTGNVVQNRTVVELREVNLATNESSTWHCPADLRLVLINPKDMAVGGTPPCTRNADVATVDNPASLSPRDKKRLEVIRRVLRVEDYYVNLSQNCVIPKDSKNSCYPNEDGDDNVTVSINYGKSSAAQYCKDDPTNGTYQCANYVSICTRDPLPN